MDTANTTKKRIVNYKMLSLLIYATLLQACGFLESDSVKEEHALFDNFKIVTNNSDPGSGSQIVLNFGEGNFQILESKCSEVNYSSEDMYIKYVKFDSLFGYSHIKLITPTKGNDKAKFTRQELNETKFIDGVNKCECKKITISE